MKHKTLRTVLLSAAIPTVLLVLFAGAFGFVCKQVIGNMTAETQHKYEKYDALAEAAPKHATVFFGDSITELCPLADLYAAYTMRTSVPVYNRGISAECTPKMLERFDTSVLALEPRNLVMLMGVNDLGQGIPEEETVSNIRQMIAKTQAACPDTNIILQAVYPIDEQREAFYERFQLGKRTNAMIASLNEKLQALAQEMQVVYLDCTPLLADENGRLKKAYSVDGLHPSVAGYQAVANALLPLLK